MTRIRYKKLENGNFQSVRSYLMDKELVKVVLTTGDSLGFEVVSETTGTVLKAETAVSHHEVKKKVKKFLRTSGVTFVEEIRKNLVEVESVELS